MRVVARGVLGILLSFCLVLSGRAEDKGRFEVLEAQTRLVAGVYQLDAGFAYTLNDTVKEALHNNVPITITVSVQVKRSRWYWLAAVVATLHQHYRLSYHDLTGHYSVTHLNTHITENFPGLRAALDSLHLQSQLPLVDEPLVRAEAEHFVHIQTYLDIEALPAALRLTAYFSRHWRLASEVYLCPLQP